MFRRPNVVECFYCQSSIDSTKANFNSRSFRCPECACWNRYDANGEIMSDEPAMHEESLNARSFALRASPRKDRIRTDYRAGPFCHACQTNQMLLVNLLANFLPEPSDPEYERRLAALPEYERSLHTRYPPVCASCAAEVEERIAEKDRMARTSALRGFLRESKGKEHARQVSITAEKREKLELRLFAWRVRGCLWAATVAGSLGFGVYLVSGRRPSPRWNPVIAALPVLMFLSVIWTFWDPSYSSMQKAYLQGRDMRLKGRSRYIQLQVIAWLSRLLSATLLALPLYRPSLDILHSTHDASSLRLRVYFVFSCVLEFIILIASFSSLRIQRPPQVRLLDTSRSRLSATPDPHGSRSSTPLPQGSGARPPAPNPPVFDPDTLLAPLTLSAQPIFAGSSTQPHNPIFGHSSMAGFSAATAAAPRVDSDGDAEMADDDAMDWSPLEPAPALAPAAAQPPTAASAFMQRVRQTAADEDDGPLLRPQRFFPPEQPTGLEGLLARTGLTDIVGPSMGTLSPRAPDPGAEARPAAQAPARWGWVYVASLVPLAGVAYYAWTSRGRSSPT